MVRDTKITPGGLACGAPTGREHGDLTCQTGQRSIGRQARDSRRPVRPATKPGTTAPCPAFGANPFHAASAGALPSAALLMIHAPLNPSIAYDWSKPPSSYHGSAAVSTGKRDERREECFGAKSAPPARTPKDGGSARFHFSTAYYVLLRLPVIRRRMPLRNRGAFTHTMRTFMSISPPARADQQKSDSHQQAARKSRPRPAGNTKKQQQKPQPDQHQTDHLRGTGALLVGLLRRAPASSLIHGHPPFHWQGMRHRRRT